jgi:hypothetical protein
VLGWDDRVVYLEQDFERRRSSGETEVVAEAIIAARFLARTGGGVPAPDVAESFGADRTSPDLPPEVTDWSRAIRLT